MEVTVGRQAILDRKNKIYGYELLFRGGNTAFGDQFDGDKATSHVIMSAFTDIGIEEVVGSSQVFVNFTRDWLTGGIPLSLPKEQLVIEVLEDITIDDAITTSVRALAADGYTIALDDFIYQEEWQPLIEVADIIKIDILGMSFDQITEQVTLLKDANVKLLAEKVESWEEFEHCKALGFDYFQGFFFSKPALVKGKTINSNRMAQLQLITELYKTDVDLGKLEQIISCDPGLSFKLLKYVNSASFQLKKTIDSIRQALVLLGLTEVKKMATMIAVASLGDTKSPELLRSALCRAKTCELIANRTAPQQKDQFFLVGILSVMDGLLDKPMAEVVDTLAISQTIHDALTSHEGDVGQTLAAVIAYEHGDLDQVALKSLSTQDLSMLFLEGAAWSLSASGAVA